MPAKTKPVTRKTRFAADLTKTGKTQGVTAKTRFTAKTAAPTTAPATGKATAGQQPTPKAKPTKQARRWASDQHVTAAHRINGQGQASGTARGDLAGNGGTYREQVRRVMIRDRNRRRRHPWLPALAATGMGLLAQGLTTLLTSVGSVPVEAVAAVFAAATLGVATIVVFSHRQTHQRWLPELAAAGVGASASVYWIGVAGLSWLTVLVLLVGTIAGGTRWWKAHPLGPGVPHLEPPRPQPALAPEPEPAAAAKPVPPPETDPYCIAWADNNARDGKAKGSRLTNRRDDAHTITYDVELKRGAQTVSDLMANRAALAGGLGEDTDRVLIRKAPRGMGAHMAQLTIITHDPVAQTRFYTGPRVQDGVIKGVSRFVDGRGEADVTMWDDGGMVPTMVVGSTGGGKSGAANVLTTGALSTGLLNLLYGDPKGNSSSALATRARVAIIGKENVLKLPWLVTAMLKARGDLAADLALDQIFPSTKIPGWMFLLDEYSLTANDPLAMKVWTETVNTVRALGIWPVALNQSLAVPQWGNDHARSAFASQVIAFRINSQSSSDLVPGLDFDPADLPVDENGRPVSGMAVHAHVDRPSLWDFLPSEANAARMREKGQPAPPYTTTTAFDAFFNQPEVHPADLFALELILGPAVNGRWQVGGPGATHQFPASLDELIQTKSPTSKPKGKWGQRSKPASGQLAPAQAEVLAIVRGGTTATGEIVDAAKAARSSVMDALDTLTSLGLIRKAERGVYEPVPQNT